MDSITPELFIVVVGLTTTCGATAEQVLEIISKLTEPFQVFYLDGCIASQFLIAK